LLLAAADDELVRGLLGRAGAVAQSRLAPRGLGVAPRSGLSLATAMRVVARVHGRASDGGPDPEPAAAAGLAARLVLVLDVTDLADRRLAVHMDAAQLARGHAHDRIVAFLREQLRGCAGRPHELASPAQGELDV